MVRLSVVRLVPSFASEVCYRLEERVAMKMTRRQAMANALRDRRLRITPGQANHIRNQAKGTTMTTATTTENITAQECFNEAAKALRADPNAVVLAMSWKDLGDGLVRLTGTENADRTARAYEPKT